MTEEYDDPPVEEEDHVDVLGDLALTQAQTNISVEEVLRKIMEKLGGTDVFAQLIATDMKKEAGSATRVRLECSLLALMEKVGGGGEVEDESVEQLEARAKALMEAMQRGQ